MADEVQKPIWFEWILVVGSFWGRWLWIWAQKSEIKKNCKMQNLNMADQNSKSCSFQIELYTQRFLEWLATNFDSKFRNSKWQIQYGGFNAKCFLIRMGFGTQRFLGSLITNLSSKFEIEKKKFYSKFQIPIWRMKMQKVVRFRWYLVLGGFWSD